MAIEYLKRGKPEADRAEDDAKTVKVIARRASLHHLDGAACEPKGHRPERARARPVHDRVHAGDDETLFLQADRAFVGVRPLLVNGQRLGGAQSHSSAPFFHS